MGSDILSVLAIFISIGVPVFEHFSNKRINSININSQYYSTVYEKYMLVEIPEHRLKLERTRAGIVKGCDEFITLLREIRKRSLCFRFVNEDFYKELIKCLQDLEDVLTLLPSNVNEDEFNTFIRKVDGLICDIYLCINEASQGRELFSQ